MNAIELSTPEFGFLLATLQCTSIIGVEDPSLFPSNKSAKTKLLKAGRSTLEQNGWIKPVPNSDDEYKLDAHLLEAVSVIAAPEHMTAGMYSDGDGKPMVVYHYYAKDDIVELSAVEQKLYWMSMLESQNDVYDRIAQLMHLDVSSRHAETELEIEVLEEVSTLVEGGKSSGVEDILGSTDLDPESIETFVSALTSNARGSQVVVSIEAGEIVSGRRFEVYGSGASAWMTYAPEPSSSSVIVQPCSQQTVEAFITALLNP